MIPFLVRMKTLLLHWIESNRFWLTRKWQANFSFCSFNLFVAATRSIQVAISNIWGCFSCQESEVLWSCCKMSNQTYKIKNNHDWLCLLILMFYFLYFLFVKAFLVSYRSCTGSSKTCCLNPLIFSTWLYLGSQLGHFVISWNMF